MKSASNSDKWRPRATLAFILATCGSFWVTIGFAISKIFVS